MTIETILEYLNAVPVRATYGAVGDVLGVRPQAVPRLLGARRPEASWIVSSSAGEPTGYPPDQVDPRLPGTHVIRTGDELRRGLESRTAVAVDAASAVAPDAAPAPDAVPAVAPETASAVEAGAVSAVEADAVSAVADDATPAGNGMPGGAAPESEPFAMSSDATRILVVLVPVVLLVAGLLAAQIASVSGGLNDRIEDLRDDFTAQIADVPAPVDEVTGLRDEIALLRSEVLGLADRLRAVEQALGLSDQSVAPAPAAGEQTTDPEAPPDADAAAEALEGPVDAPAEDADAPAADPDAQPGNPDPQPDPPIAPVTPVENPVPPRE